MTIASRQGDKHMELSLRERKERLRVWRSSGVAHPLSIYHSSLYRQVIHRFSQIYPPK
jgi:hypothetical protein